MKTKFINQFIGKSIAKIVKKSLWVASFFVPLLLTQVALAGQKLTDFSFTPVAADVSVTFLKKIFGTVGGVLVATGSTVMGQIFYVFNCGILVVIGSVLFYTISKSIIDIAHGDPSQMGRKFSWWLPGRVVLGIGMIVPNSAGYSFLNVIVMWLVLQGVGLADSIWSQVVNYVGKGGALYTYVGKEPTGQAAAAGTTDLDRIDYKLINGYVRRGETAGASDILRSQLCMYALQRVIDRSKAVQLEKIKSAPDEYPPAVKAAFNATYPALREQYDDTAMALYFPGNTPTLPLPNQSEPQNLQGKCGAYTWGNVPAPSNATDVDQEGPKKYQDAKKVGITSMAIILKSTAQSVINDYNMNTETPKAENLADSVQRTAYTNIVSAAATYQSLIREMRLYAGNGYKELERAKPGEDWDKLSKKMTEGGWVTAGTYFFKLAQLTELPGEPEKDKYAPDIYQNQKAPRCDYTPINISTPSNTSTTPPCVPTEQATAITNLISKYLPGTEGGKFQDLFTDHLGWFTTYGTPEGMPQQTTQLGSIFDDGGSSIYSAALLLADKLNSQMLVSGGKIESLSSVLADFATKPRVKIVYAPSGRFNFQNAFDVVLDPLNDMLTSVGKAWYAQFASSTAKVTFPLLSLQNLGHAMIDSCFNFWSAVIDSLLSTIQKWYWSTAVISGVVSALSWIGFWGAGTGAQQAVMSLLNFAQVTFKVFYEIPIMLMLPIGFAISTLVLVNGVMLYFYLPLIPFMLFLFGVVSWLSFVIEGMVATPLIALGLTHPEGHDLLGKVEQTLMLWVAMFVRPAALIIGLIAGVVLSFVAIDVLNAGFGVLTTDMFPTTLSKDISLGVRQTTIMALLMIYTLIVISLMQQCFALINVVPARITRWIGLPEEHGMEAQLAEAVKTGITGAAQAAGGAVSAPKEISAVAPMLGDIKALQPERFKKGEAGAGAIEKH